MKLKLRTFELPLRDPFTISRGTTTVQTTVVVAVEHDGVIGYGEATENDYYRATVGGMQKDIELVVDLLLRTPLGHPASLWDQLADRMSSRFALCAVDCALWDLWGKSQGKTVQSILRAEFEVAVNDRLPQSSYTIGMASPNEMLRKLRSMPDWPIYKIKVGSPGDLPILQTLRTATDRPFRVDANGGWTAAEAKAILPELVRLGVEMIEQPLRVDDADMIELRKVSPLPLIADESCETEEQIDQCAGVFDGINIKLVKCGGLTPALRMVRKARKLGLQLMVGCMTESSVGISAAAQLLPWLDYADLDGAVLLAQDIASGVHVDRGAIQFSQRAGLGIAMDSKESED